MTLLQKTREIINDSIKSVIFIDEKAYEPFSTLPSGNNIETTLSKNLLKKFKTKGISLAIHKFSPSDFDNANKISYLLKKRDLVLLDWKLDGESGEEYSLRLLSKIIQEKNIHFCSIYTSQNNSDEIINNILSYFSGFDRAYYQNIFNELDPYLDGQEVLLDQISYNDKEINKNLIQSFIEINSELPRIITEFTNIKGLGDALIQVKIAFSNLQKAEQAIKYGPKHLNRDNKSLNINNTIITIISKDEDNASKIVNKIISQVSKSENCYSQILGLDMQNVFNNETSFIDENLLDTNLDTLMFHRRQLINNNLENEFENFIKIILLEHSKLKLENSLLKTLDKTFLDRVTKRRLNIESHKIAKLNTFYNGSFINNKTLLNFGDVFKDKKGNFYLCITPLCDCILHNGKSNIGFKYYFVKGQKSDLEEAINVGEKGFVSFLDDKTSVIWKQDEYIKPFQLYIPNPSFKDNKIIYLDWNKKQDKEEIEIEYIFTIKQNYTQRIVNHAFGHPIRVGVDFVKK